MRCRQARKLMGFLVDGELGERDADRLRSHLAACRSCALRYQHIQFLVRELARFPEVRPTPRESLQLRARLQEEMSAPRPHRSAWPAPRWAAVAVSVLLVAGVAVAWTLLEGRKAMTPVVETTPLEAGSGEVWSEAGYEAQALSLQDIYPGSAEELVVHPSLILSGREYAISDLGRYGEDIGLRMAFYSAYWYPIGGDMRSPYLPRLREQLVGDLTRQAARAGLDPAELSRSLEVALSEAGGNLLPCRAELARVQGREVWLISLSGPEDYLLFPDPQVPPALHLAARGGQESLKLSQSLLQELASYLLPQGRRVSAREPGMEGAAQEAGASGETGTGDQRTAETPAAQPGITSDEEFQVFLREMAAQGNPAEAVAALQALNYEQLLLLLQGDWSALASRGVDLSDFLLPPRRLAAVERNTTQVIWKAF
ncbi:MAG: anti-sigma factor family protein [Actinomycetota bacterium]